MVDVVRLRVGELSLRVGPHGGVILGFRLGGLPVLRPALSEAPGDAACFPLLPIGNRIRDNRFSLDGREYHAQPNTAEPLHLHGAGWLADWRVEEAGADFVRLSHAHDGPDLPHRYKAGQSFALTADSLRIEMTVTNTGDAVLPFGLGWHPFFAGGALLTAPATGFFSEAPDHLPAGSAPMPADLDFAAPRPLPDRWVNNAFAGWTGAARIDWPATGLSVGIEADPLFDCYQLYRPAEGGFFAFEPMSHLPDALSMPDLGGLRLLAPGETLAGGITLSPRITPGAAGDIAGDRP